MPEFIQPLGFPPEFSKSLLVMEDLSGFPGQNRKETCWRFYRSGVFLDSFLDFIEYFNQQETISEAFVSFFCLLELIKARIVVAIQESLFHTIKVWLRKESPS